MVSLNDCTQVRDDVFGVIAVGSGNFLRNRREVHSQMLAVSAAYAGCFDPHMVRFRRGCMACKWESSAQTGCAWFTRDRLHNLRRGAEIAPREGVTFNAARCETARSETNVVTSSDVSAGLSARLSFAWSTT